MTTNSDALDLRVASSDQSRPERSALPGRALAGGAGSGPLGIWHGYFGSASKTLCGQALAEMYRWPDARWPGDAPAGAACYPCQLVVEHRA